MNLSKEIRCLINWHLIFYVWSFTLSEAYILTTWWGVISALVISMSVLVWLVYKLAVMVRHLSSENLSLIEKNKELECRIVVRLEDRMTMIESAYLAEQHNKLNGDNNG